MLVIYYDWHVFKYYIEIGMAAYKPKVKFGSKMGRLACLQVKHKDWNILK